MSPDEHRELLDRAPPRAGREARRLSSHPPSERHPPAGLHSERLRLRSILLAASAAHRLGRRTGWGANRGCSPTTSRTARSRSIRKPTWREPKHPRSRPRRATPTDGLGAGRSSGSGGVNAEPRRSTPLRSSRPRRGSSEGRLRGVIPAVRALTERGCDLEMA